MVIFPAYVIFKDWDAGSQMNWEESNPRAVFEKAAICRQGSLEEVLSKKNNLGNGVQWHD